MLFFPLGHVLVGVFITWKALVKTLNRSRFVLDHDSFVLQHGPIWERGARFATRDLEGFDTLASVDKGVSIFGSAKYPSHLDLPVSDGSKLP